MGERFRREGRSRQLEQVLYIWSENILGALDKYKNLHGVQRSKVPTIIKLTSAEESILEETICTERSLDIKKVRDEYIRYSIRGHELPPV